MMRLITIITFTITLTLFPKTVFAQEDNYQYDKDSVGVGEIVNVTFGEIDKQDISNAVFILNVKDIQESDYIHSVYTLLEGRIPGLLGTSNIRGWGSPLFLVDGVPLDPSYVRVSEIEQIAVMKDVNSAILYGSTAQNGVVLITTKKGRIGKNVVEVHGQYGLSEPRALPQYLSSVSYMEQHNIARLNDGFTPLYGQQTINNFRYGNPYMYPDVDYYSNDYLKSVKPYSDVNLVFSGGNKTATYFSSLSWQNQGSLLDFGEGKSSSNNILNARANVELKVNNWIKTSIHALGVFGFDKQPIGDYWSDASTYRPNDYVPLVPIGYIDPDNDLLKSSNYTIEGKYLPGGNVSYQTNPIANVYLGGHTTKVDRLISFSNKTDVDLNNLLEGLSFHALLNGNFLNTYDEYIENKYATYEAQWNNNESAINKLTKFGIDERDGQQKLSNGYSTSQYSFRGMLSYNRTFNTDHRFSGNALVFGSYTNNSTIIQSDKNSNFGFRAAYCYANKYLVDFSSALVYSVKLKSGNRFAFSPSLSLAWVLSNENFMSSFSFVDYLKLKMSAGIINTDQSMGYGLFDDKYHGTGAFYWYDGLNARGGIEATHASNPHLSFEKRKDINVGLEGKLFDKHLSFDFNFFNNVRSDIVVKATTLYPSYMASYAPYQNMDKHVYRGFELGLAWEHKLNDFKILVGGNLMYSTSEVLETNEIYRNAYQYRKGHPVDAYFGLVSNGLFNNADDVDQGAIPAFGAVQPGDIKYSDLDNNKIIDTDDEKMIGRSQSPFSYSLYVNLSYKRFTLFAIGDGRTGGYGYLGNYGSYYWAQGDAKYSEYMLNHWTEETAATATYPRLSSRNNDNNFRMSDFWLYKDDYFDLKRVQLTYSIPLKENNKLSLQKMSVFVNASNILTISPNKDIRVLNISSEPQYRSYAIGLKAMF